MNRPVAWPAFGQWVACIGGTISDSKPLLDRQREARCFFMITDYLTLNGGWAIRVQEDVGDLVMDGVGFRSGAKRLRYSRRCRLGELAIILNHSSAVRSTGPSSGARCNQAAAHTRLKVIPCFRRGSVGVSTRERVRPRSAAVRRRPTGEAFQSRFGPVFSEYGEEHVGTDRNVGMSGYPTARIDVVESASGSGESPRCVHGHGRALPAGTSGPGPLPEPLSARATWRADGAWSGIFCIARGSKASAAGDGKGSGRVAVQKSTRIALALRQRYVAVGPRTGEGERLQAVAPGEFVEPRGRSPRHAPQGAGKLSRDAPR